MSHPNHTKKTTGFLTMTAFIVVALSGCVAEDAQASSLYVKDALTDDAAEVHVTFTAVEVLPAQATEWITVHQGEQSIDLLALSAPEAKAKLAELDLAPGSYDGLRIAASEAELVYENGTTVDLVVAGNVIELASAFEVGSAGGLQILVDFDLDRSVDAEAGIYAPAVKEMRTSAEDIDGDGESDFEDTDDPGLPEPAQERHNGFGLCTAWHNTETARAQNNSTVADSPAFQNLSRMAAESNQTIEEYCDAQEFPGPPEAVPEEAQAYYEEAMARREAREDNAQQGRDGAGADENRTAGNENRTAGDESRPSGQDGQATSGNETRSGGSGNETQTGRPE